MAYQPRANSLPGKVLDFLRRNPEEELTADDITEKFGGVRGNVHTLMRPALDAGLVKREPDLLGEHTYRIGVNLGKASKAVSKALITQEVVAKPQQSPLDLRIAQLEIQPGDTLVVSSERLLKATEINNFCTALQSCLPQGVSIVYLEPGRSLCVLRGKPTPEHPTAAAQPSTTGAQS